MFPFPDINLKKISFPSWKKGGHFHSIYKQKSQQPAILIFHFGSCRAQANLNFQLFPLCWHRQCKAESKQGLTALLAPSGWGCRGRLSWPTLPVPPAAIARLFILHALGEGGSSDSSSAAALLSRTAAQRHWGAPRLPPHGWHPSWLSRISSRSGEGLFHAPSYIHFCYTFRWKQLSCRYCSAVWIVMAVFWLLRLLVSSSIFLPGELPCAGIFEVLWDPCFRVTIIIKDTRKNWSIAQTDGWVSHSCLFFTLHVQAISGPGMDEKDNAYGMPAWVCSVPDRISCDRENRC